MQSYAEAGASTVRNHAPPSRPVRTAFLLTPVDFCFTHFNATMVGFRTVKVSGRFQKNDIVSYADLVAGSFPMSLIPAHRQWHIPFGFSVYSFLCLCRLPSPFTIR